MSNADESDPKRQFRNVTSSIQSSTSIYILVIVDHVDSRKMRIISRYMKLGNLEINDEMFGFEKTRQKCGNQKPREQNVGAAGTYEIEMLHNKHEIDNIGVDILSCDPQTLG